MAKSTVPKGKVKIAFNLPIELVEKLKERARVENWSYTTALTEAVKEFTRDY